MQHTLFLAGANLGRPSSSICISVSSSLPPLGIIGSTSDGRAFGASRRNSASSSVPLLDYYWADVDIGSILLLGKGTFIASANSSGCLRSAVGAGILSTLPENQTQIIFILLPQMSPR
jgi:hypothetical protein